MWLHVDAAYGGFFALTERVGARAAVSSWPTHARSPQGAFSPWGTGCLLVREGDALSETFRMYPAYLRDAREHDDAVNLFDRGLQLTRPARAVKIWLSVRTLGLAPFRAALDEAIDHARFAQSIVEADPRAELVTPASLGIVTFRRTDGRDEETARAYNAGGGRSPLHHRPRRQGDAPALHQQLPHHASRRGPGRRGVAGAPSHVGPP